MKKLSSTLPNMIIVLTATTMLSGFLLGFVYGRTAEAREKATADKLTAAVEVVISGFDNNPVTSKREITVSEKRTVIYPAYKNDELIGCAVESSSDNGFSGKITVVTGFDKDCNILGYEVTQHGETPGLGAKMNEWFRGGSRSVIGKNPTTSSLKVSKDGGDIDGITAATISSRAFLEAVNTAGEAARKFYAGQ